MNPTQIALGVVGAIVAIFGLSFTVFWSIIKSTEKNLCDKINKFSETIVSCQAKRDVKSKEIFDRLNLLTIEQTKTASFDYCEATYVRKREHELEFGILKDKLDDVIDCFQKAIDNKAEDNKAE